MIEVYYSRTVPIAAQECNCKSAVKVAFMSFTCSDRANKQYKRSKFFFPTLHVKHAKVGNYVVVQITTYQQL